MTRPHPRVSSVAAARRRLVVTAIVVALAGSALLWRGHDTPAGSTSSRRPFAGELLVYGRHGLTDAEVARLRKAARSTVTPVYGGEVAVDSGRPDYPQVPIQLITVAPRSYATAANVPRLAQELSAGVVLSRLGARLRRAEVGGHLALADGRRLRISAIEDDGLLGGHEAATSEAVLGRQAGPAASYLLVRAGSHADATARRLRAALPDKDLRIEAKTKNGILSSADSVLTQAQIKTEFGEFALRADPSGVIHLDPAWIKAWIVTTQIPQLGVVSCNRALVAPLRAAMEEVTSKGLASLIHTRDFQLEGGCWNPRVARFGAGQLSSHAWGIAVDINVDVNPLGAEPRQDPRVVEIMRAHGFTWGGQFLRPDGAHFEWIGTSR